MENTYFELCVSGLTKRTKKKKKIVKSTTYYLRWKSLEFENIEDLYINVRH